MICFSNDNDGRKNMLVARQQFKLHNPSRLISFSQTRSGHYLLTNKCIRVEKIRFNQMSNEIIVCK